MEYVFSGNVLKVVDTKHSDLEGWQEIVREFQNETIVDHFNVIKKIKEDSDAEGRCYDWYRIDGHYRIIDRTKPLVLAQEEMEAAFCDADAQNGQRLADMEAAICEIDMNGGIQ